MSEHSHSNYPKLHNAMWPGLVGKGSPGAEPCIGLDEMLDLTANAQVDGVRFDGIDLFLFDPHVSIDSDEDALKRLAAKVAAKGFVVGSVVAPVWGPTGGGSAMGSDEDRARFVGQVTKACRIAQKLRQLGVRPHGVVRIDSACSVEDWTHDPDANQRRIAQTFSEACNVAESFGEKLAAEGEICWGGMHSWKNMLNLLERVNRPNTLGFQADMAHTLLYTLGYNEPGDALLPDGWDWSDPNRLDEALKQLTTVLRPWTIDFHVAQNDATVHGSGTHDKTGHHCLPNDPNGKLRIAHHAGYWLHGQDGRLTKALRHVCWDGCMFPNEVMMQPQTWNDILAAMIAVRDAHGWREEPAQKAEVKPAARIVSPRGATNKPSKTRQPARRKQVATPTKRKSPAKPIRRATPMPSAKKRTPSKPSAKKPTPSKPTRSKKTPAKAAKKQTRSARRPAQRVTVKAAPKSKSKKARTSRKTARRR